jgi:hypothetical protein
MIGSVFLSLAVALTEGPESDSICVSFCVGALCGATLGFSLALVIGAPDAALHGLVMGVLIYGFLAPLIIGVATGDIPFQTSDKTAILSPITMIVISSFSCLLSGPVTSAFIWTMFWAMRNWSFVKKAMTRFRMLSPEERERLLSRRIGMLTAYYCLLGAVSLVSVYLTMRFSVPAVYLLPITASLLLCLYTRRVLPRMWLLVLSEIERYEQLSP